MTFCLLVHSLYILLIIQLLNLEINMLSFSEKRRNYYLDQVGVTELLVSLCMLHCKFSI